MARIISYRCPRCNTSLDWSAGSTLEVGSPLWTCKKCGQEIVVSHYKEWESASTGDRVYLLLSPIGGGIFLGLISGLVIYLATANVPYYTRELAIYGGGAVAIVFWSILCSLGQWRQIKMSKQRMTDPTYRERLKRHGKL